METATRRRTKPRTRRGTNRGRGPIEVSVKRTAHTRMVLLHLLAYSAAPDGWAAYADLRAACGRHRIAEPEFQAELGRLTDEGVVSVAEHRTPVGVRFNQYRIEREVIVR